MSQTNRCSIRYARTQSFGVPASPMNMLEVLRTDAEFKGMVETIESEAVRSDRMVQGVFEVGRNGGDGTFSGEVAYGQFDGWLEDVLCGTWSTPVSISASNIDFAAGDSSINRASGSFISDNVLAGMHILVAGSAANSKVHRVVSVTALKIVSDQVITTEASGPSISIKNGGMLRNGIVERSNTVEEAYLDVNQFYVYDDARATSLQLEIAPKSLVKATFGFKCRDFRAPSGSTISAMVTAPNNNLAFNTTKNIKGMLEGGTSFAEIITGLSISIDNNVEAIDGVGNDIPAQMPYRKQRVTGNTELYHSATLASTIAKFRNQSESSLRFRIEQTTPGLYLILTIPALKYTGGSPRAGAQDTSVPVAMPWSAYRHVDNYQVQFDRISAV